MTIASHLACKESCDDMLAILHRNRHGIAGEDYDRLHRFLTACRRRLPRRATYERAVELRLERYTLPREPAALAADDLGDLAEPDDATTGVDLHRAAGGEGPDAG